MTQMAANLRMVANDGWDDHIDEHSYKDGHPNSANFLFGAVTKIGSAGPQTGKIREN